MHNNYFFNINYQFLYIVYYSFIMDWPDKKQIYQKQPPDKKQKPKYVAKAQVQGQQPSQAKKSVAAQKYPSKNSNNNQKYASKKYQEKQKIQQIQERPRFIEKASSNDGSLNCLICSQFIRKKQAIWTCQSCGISLHLKCIKQWIKKTNEGNKEQDTKKFLLNWSCIQCKTEYHESMPQYYCFCGKFKNPEYQRDLQPHSCGKPCQRKRGNYCPHLCPQLCHSGKCKPCQHQGSIVTCSCGKTQRMAKCSQERSAFQCGKKCEKMLACGKHKCERNCHYGECFPCKKKHLVSCYCGKNQDVVDCIKKSYQCQMVCDKLLDCGYHKCQKDCHSGPCGPCTKTPQLQTTCHCGRYQLMMISQIQRQSCKDPIPSCGMPCKKKLSCGHECTKVCHEGRCPQCKVIVQQLCRCGSTQRKIQCFKAKLTKQQFHCDTICKKKRSCGIHVCNTECCKFKNFIGAQGHQCQLTCQKTLNCERHTCDLPCHAGLCKKCPVIYSQPQPCPCGATSLRPPVICGTVTPQCDNPCNKQMPCGHNCLNLCHYGPCKCRQQVQVTCRCGKQKIKTVCGREALCLTKCQNMLQCGHKCLVQCHSGTCESAHKQGCFQKCEKIRLDCGHKCRQICHYGKKCQQFSCQAQILIKCQCGHRQTTVICGSHGNIQGAHKKKQIVCNKKCQNMKRFDILYKGKEIYYPNYLMQYGFKNFNYLQKIEQKLQKFISESDAHFVEIQFKQIGDHSAKMALHNLFENHYHLNTHFYRHMKTASFTLTQTENTMIPKPSLTEYIKQVAKGSIKRTNLPFQYTIKFDGESKQKSDVILKSLKSYIHKYYVQRKDKMVLVHFWNKQEGIQAQQKLQNQNQSMAFTGEENITKLEENQQIDMNQIIQTQVIEEEGKKQSNAAQDQKNNQIQQIKREQKQIDRKVEQKQETHQKVGEKKQNKQQTGEQQKKQKPKMNIRSAKQAPKIVIRKGAPNFVRSQFPPSSENVQDLYVIDEDELYGDEVDWNKIVAQLIDKKMGIEASEWRIRALLMISVFHKIDQKILAGQFSRIVDLYEKDKQKSRRILQLQKLQIKKIQPQMKQNQIYLSDHQPEILSYCILYNYFAHDKIEFDLSDECSETREVQRSLQIIQNTQKCNFQQFYNEFRNSDYILACTMIPFVHQIRQNFLKAISNQKRISVQNLYKYLLFESQEQLLSYGKENGLEIGRRYSKSKKIQQYTLIEGKLNDKMHQDVKFIKTVHQKRDHKYFLAEPNQLVDGKWMTRSFFAFGDFKESISPKYMIALCRNLRGD